VAVVAEAEVAVEAEVAEAAVEAVEAVEAEVAEVAEVAEAAVAVARRPGQRPARRRGRARSCCSGSEAPAAADRSCCSA
jgi:hypothetical protein